MLSVHDVFQENLARVRVIHGLHQNFSGMVSPIVDLSDILRSEFVLIVSALDHFVHGLTLDGMMEVWGGKKVPTPAYLRFPIPMQVAMQLASGSATASHIEAEIRSRHSYLAFQQPDKIADAIRLISAIELWDQLGQLLNTQPKQIKAELKLIIDRRNKIAHEADIDPSYPGQRWPIDRIDVEQALSFVEMLGNAIYALIR